MPDKSSASATPATGPSQRFTGHYWRQQAIIRQRIIDKQNSRITQLEQDYDLVEAELKAMLTQPTKAKPRCVVS